MGFFGDISGSTGRRAAREGAKLQNALGRDAHKTLYRTYTQDRSRLLPFVNTGSPFTGKKGSLAQFASLRPYGERIDDILNSDFLDPIVNDRLDTVRQELGRVGLRRSGAGLEAIADVRPELAMAIEQQLYGRQAGLADMSSRTALGLGALGANFAGANANVLTGIGDALAQGEYNKAQSSIAGTGNLLGLGTALAGAVPWGAVGSRLGGLFGGGPDLGTMRGLVPNLPGYSDRRLKTNVKAVGEEAGLTVYEWDWIDEAPDFLKKQAPAGFMADEVYEKYPEAVDVFAGLLIVNYPELLEVA